MYILDTPMLSELNDWDGKHLPGILMVGLLVAVLFLLRWYSRNRSQMRSAQERERLRKEFWGWG